MENEVANPEEKAITEITDTKDISSLLDQALPPVEAPEILEDMVPAWDTSPSVILIQTQSPYVAPPHRVTPGNFILRKSKDEFVDLGESLDALIIDWRPKALHTEKGNASSIQIVFDRESDAFKEIQEAADNRSLGYFWGFEFLIYLCDMGVYANLYCNNVTLRNVARGDMLHYLRKVATLKSHLIKKESTGYQWFSFTCSECTAPLGVPLKLEELQEKQEDFKNPEEVDRNLGSGKTEEAASADTRER